MLHRPRHKLLERIASPGQRRKVEMPAVYAKHRDHAARPDSSTFVTTPDLAKEPDQGAVVSWPGRVGLLVSSAVKRERATRVGLL
jgi:hypothetical protein